MKKVIFLFIALFIFINVQALESLKINSNNAILYNLNDNSVIYEKNSDDIVQIASLTKIVTAINLFIKSECMVPNPMSEPHSQKFLFSFFSAALVFEKLSLHFLQEGFSYHLQHCISS